MLLWYYWDVVCKVWACIRDMSINMTQMRIHMSILVLLHRRVQEWAMGDGMSALYMELGWEKGTWGFGDTQADEIPKQDAIFVSNIRYDVVPENFKLVQEFIYYDIAFGYFVKEEEVE